MRRQSEVRPVVHEASVMLSCPTLLVLSWVHAWEQLHWSHPHRRRDEQRHRRPPPLLMTILLLLPLLVVLLMLLGRSRLEAELERR